MNAWKLNKIYDLIDAGSFKESITQCKYILKSSQSDLVKSLLAFSYSRSGDIEAAKSLALELVSTAPTSTDTLAALNLTLSDLREFNTLADLYKQLWNKSGSNLDSNAKLSMSCYLKAQNWKSIQSVSIRLSKIARHPHNITYTWWSVAALLMQSICAINDQEKRIAFSLALRLSDSLECDNAQQVYLLTRLYTLSGDPNRAALLLEQHQQHVQNSLALEELQWDVLNSLNDYHTIRHKAQQLLQGGSQNYSHHTAYLSTITQDDIDQATALFNTLIHQNPKERGHLMALMELARKFNHTSLPSLVLRYWHQFKNKPVCFDDLVDFVRHSYQQNQDITGLRDLFSTSLHNSSEELDTRINAAKLSRCLSITTTVERDLSDAELFASLYKSYLYAAEGVPSTDIHPADDWSILASLCFISAYHKTHDTAHLEAAVAFMESALLSNGRSYKLKILLISVYRILGRSRTFQVVRSMRIQSVQQDTLTQYGCGHVSSLAVSSGDVAGVLPNTSSYRSVWAQSERECSEMLARLFENGTWPHLEDFTEFAARLSKSIHKWVLWFENVRVKVAETGRVEEQQLEEWRKSLEEMGDVDALVDNRDWSLLPTCSPLGESAAREQLRVLTYQDRGWLRAYKGIYGRVLNLALYKSVDESEAGENCGNGLDEVCLYAVIVVHANSPDTAHGS